MRVTQSMMAQDFLRQLNGSYSKLADLQQQLATGKKITRPSQDPVVATLGIAYRTDVAHVDQFTRNMDNVHKWMDNSDAALDQANSVLQRIRELTVEGSNGTYTDDQRKSIQKEVTQLKEQLVTIANTKVGGQYIFNGTDTGNPPVTLNADGTVTTNYGTNPSDVLIEVNDGIKIGVNVNPSQAFPQGLFDNLNGLETALSKTGSSGKEIGDFLDKIDGNISQLVSSRSELGARENRVEMIDNRISSQKQIAETIMSKNEDADFEKVLVEFQTQQSVHRAALAVGAKIIQPTLVDFLR
jgi:flagellar hook-associated protein 3 FlgL